MRKIIITTAAALLLAGVSGPAFSQQKNESAAEQADKNKERGSPATQNQRDIKENEQAPSTSSAPTAPRTNNR